MLGASLRAADGTRSSATPERETALGLRIHLAPVDSSIHHLLAVLHRKRVIIEMLSFQRGCRSHEVAVELRVRAGLEVNTVRAIEREVQVISVTSVDRALG